MQQREMNRELAFNPFEEGRCAVTNRTCDDITYPEFTVIEEDGAFSERDGASAMSDAPAGTRNSVPEASTRTHAATHEKGFSGASVLESSCQALMANPDMSRRAFFGLGAAIGACTLIGSILTPRGIMVSAYAAESSTDDPGVLFEVRVLYRDEVVFMAYDTSSSPKKLPNGTLQYKGVPGASITVVPTAKDSFTITTDSQGFATQRIEKYNMYADTSQKYGFIGSVYGEKKGYETYYCYGLSIESGEGYGENTGKLSTTTIQIPLHPLRDIEYEEFAFQPYFRHVSLNDVEILHEESEISVSPDDDTVHTMELQLVSPNPNQSFELSVWKGTKKLIKDSNVSLIADDADYIAEKVVSSSRDRFSNIAEGYLAIAKLSIKKNDWKPGDILYAVFSPSESVDDTFFYIFAIIPATIKYSPMPPKPNDNGYRKNVKPPAPFQDSGTGKKWLVTIFNMAFGFPFLPVNVITDEHGNWIIIVNVCEYTESLKLTDGKPPVNDEAGNTKFYCPWSKKQSQEKFKYKVQQEIDKAYTDKNGNKNGLRNAKKGTAPLATKFDLKLTLKIIAAGTSIQKKGTSGKYADDYYFNISAYVEGKVSLIFNATQYWVFYGVPVHISIDISFDTALKLGMSWLAENALSMKIAWGKNYGSTKFLAVVTHVLVAQLSAGAGIRNVCAVGVRGYGSFTVEYVFSESKPESEEADYPRVISSARAKAGVYLEVLFFSGFFPFADTKECVWFDSAENAKKKYVELSEAELAETLTKPQLSFSSDDYLPPSAYAELASFYATEDSVTEATTAEASLADTAIAEALVENTAADEAQPKEDEAQNATLLSDDKEKTNKEAGDGAQAAEQTIVPTAEIASEQVANRPVLQHFPIGGNANPEAEACLQAASTGHENPYKGDGYNANIGIKAIETKIEENGYGTPRPRVIHGNKTWDNSSSTRVFVLRTVVSKITDAKTGTIYNRTRVRVDTWDTQTKTYTLSHIVDFNIDGVDSYQRDDINYDMDVYESPTGEKVLVLAITSLVNRPDAEEAEYKDVEKKQFVTIVCEFVERGQIAPNEGNVWASSFYTLLDQGIFTYNPHVLVQAYPKAGSQTKAYPAFVVYNYQQKDDDTTITGTLVDPNTKAIIHTTKLIDFTKLPTEITSKTLRNGSFTVASPRRATVDGKLYGVIAWTGVTNTDTASLQENEAGNTVPVGENEKNNLSFFYPVSFDEKGATCYGVVSATKVANVARRTMETSDVIYAYHEMCVEADVSPHKLIVYNPKTHGVSIQSGTGFNNISRYFSSGDGKRLFAFSGCKGHQPGVSEQAAELIDQGVPHSSNCIKTKERQTRHSTVDYKEGGTIEQYTIYESRWCANANAYYGFYPLAQVSCYPDEVDVVNIDGGVRTFIMASVTNPERENKEAFRSNLLQVVVNDVIALEAQKACPVVPYVGPGEPITFELAVKNTGNTPITNFTVKVKCSLKGGKVGEEKILLNKEYNSDELAERIIVDSDQYQIKVDENGKIQEDENGNPILFLDEDARDTAGVLWPGTSRRYYFEVNMPSDAKGGQTYLFHVCVLDPKCKMNEANVASLQDSFANLADDEPALLCEEFDMDPEKATIDLFSDNFPTKGDTLQTFFYAEESDSAWFELDLDQEETDGSNIPCDVVPVEYNSGMPRDESETAKTGDHAAATALIAGAAGAGAVALAGAAYAGHAEHAEAETAEE